MICATDSLLTGVPEIGSGRAAPGNPGSWTAEQPWSPPPAAPDDSARAAGRVVSALAELQGWRRGRPGPEEAG